MEATTIPVHGQGSAERDPDPEELVLALRDTNRALQTFLTAHARANGLSLPEFITLARSADGDGVTPYEAGRVVGMRSSTMTSLSDRLEHDGLICRVAHPSDRRLVLLKATQRGRELLEGVRGPLFASLGELVASVEPGERKFLARFLDQVTALSLHHASSQPPARRSRRSSSSVPPRPRAPLPTRTQGN